jgi:hypothetical protein
MVDIRITTSELSDPAIDEVVNLEKSLQRKTGEFVEDIRTPFYLNPIFYYSLAAVAACLGMWAVLEPLYNETKDRLTVALIANYVYFGSEAAAIGLAMGLAYGLSNRNLTRAVYCGAVGIGIGLLVSLVTSFIAGLEFGMGTHMAISFLGREDWTPGTRPHFHGLAFFVLMCARGLAWSIAAIGAGLGLGVALKSRKLLLNGVAGGLIGGLLGGLMFDPIDRFIGGWGATATLSRAVGLSAVGLLVGLFIGFFENMSKEAWFLMMRGPLSGKQFILFKSPMIIGSAPKCDIYLFKDAAIEPRHASVSKRGSKYLLEDGGSSSGTFVNSKKIDKYILQPGDIVSIGETVLKYHEQQKK